MIINVICLFLRLFIIYVDKYGKIRYIMLVFFQNMKLVIFKTKYIDGKTDNPTDNIS